MKRKNKLKKTLNRIIAGVISISVAVPTVPLWAAQPQTRMTTAPAAGEISVNPEIRYQTLKGWGTSLCWWGNIIGSWGDNDFNGNGRPDREEIAELAFSPEYLNLNIVRYNVGGGDKEDTSIKRCEGLVPGWTEDMTGTKDGTGVYDEAAFLAKPTEQMADAGQLWMLEQANKWRKETAEKNKTQNDIINEVFSNSPPYYMTKSGSSTGGNNGEENNLKDDQYGAFAEYLARAAKWINQDLTEKYSTKVDYIEPLNEPDTGYWMNGSTKQEGCIFNTGELQSKAYQEMKTALTAAGLTGIQITGTDETGLEKAINSYKRLEDDVKQNMTTIGAHTYSGNDSQRKELRRIAQSDDKDLWMSEVTKGGSGHNHNSMEAVNAKDQSEGIMADLKYMQPTAWIAWLLADSEYECIQTDSNWGLLHATFEKDGRPAEGYHTFVTTDDANYKEGYWAVTKQFYTMMQYSRFLKQGYTMIDVGDGNMCAAIAPDGSELVIVAQNFGNARSTTVDLGKFTDIETAEMYRTSDREDCRKMAYDQDVSDHVLDADLPKNSVTTYVIKAKAGKTVCDMASSIKIVDADVTKSVEWASDIDKFQYTGSWGESGSCDGKYTTADGGAVTFKFDGERARIYGTKGEECRNISVSVDGGEGKTVDISGSGKDMEALLYDTGKLTKGEHTVTIARQDGLLEVNYAQVISGDYSPAEVQPCDPVYTVSGVVPILPETVEVTVGEKTEERKVAWDAEDVDFSKAESKVTLKGSVLGVSQKASIDVYVAAMENAVYFIDCNAPDSPNMKYYADLVNQTADQKYEGENQWGYLGDYEGQFGTDYDNYNMYWTGWYNSGGEKSVEYKLPLEAGDYNVTFGFQEWWSEWNSSRAMKVFMKQGDSEEQELGSTNTWDGGNSWNTDTFAVSLEKAEDVTFKVKLDCDANEAVLSFLQVQKKLNLDTLKEALKKFNAMDESKFASKPQELAALKKAAADGHKLLYLSSATQTAVDAAAADIEQKMATLGKIEVVLDAKTLEQNDYVLYTANCGTPDPYRIPNKESERLGLLQSKVDQAFGEDSLTGYDWGRDTDTANAKAVVYGDGDAVDIGNSFIYLADDITFDKEQTALGYTFEVPDLSGIDGIEPDMYEVTVAFKQPWGDKNANILLEGRTAATDVSFGSNQWVSRTFTTQVKDGKLNVQVKNPRRKSGNDDPVLNYIKVRAVKHTEPQIITYDSISGTQGAPLYDTQGKLIQAHGGQIQQLTVDGVTKWYWIGEDKTYDYRPCGGIHMYSSTDLYNWKDEGVVLKTMESMKEFETDDYFKNLYGELSQDEKENVFEDLDRNNCVMERPKMLYNDKTGKYVIWFHADGRTRTNPDADYGKAKAGVAIGDSPVGPFKLLGSYKLNHTGDNYGYDGYDNRGSVRDMNLFKDDDGTAYVIYSSEGNETTYISKLNEEYTNIAGDRENGVAGTDFIRAFGWSREAPAPFKYNGKYYIINSGCSGWSPNQAECWMADDIFGEWEAMGDPCPDWGNGTTYDTQSTCVIPVDPAKGYYIYMGDRWNAGDLSESRYVWLLVEFQEDNGKAVIKRCDNWKVEEVWDMSEDADTTRLDAAIKAAEAVERNEKDYTSKSWSDYQKALEGAKALLENPGKFQSTVDAAVAALNSAIERLKTLVEVLDEALDAYGTISGDRDDYTQESLQVYDEALKAAQDLKKAGGFTETRMDEVIEELKAAFDGLKTKTADITELKKAIDKEKAAQRNESDYTVASWEEYDAALKAAERFLETPGEDQELVDKAIEALDAAVQGLVTLKSLLAGALDEYAVNPDLQDQYTQESWKAYEDALKDVQDLQETDSLTETQVTRAIGRLKEAFKGLTKAEEKPSVVPVAKITVSGSSNKLLKGKKITLKANVLPVEADNKTVTWNTSNKRIATVDSHGVVTAKGAGTVSITATANDGSGVKGSYKITITDAVTKITLSSGTKGIAAGKKVTVKPTIKVTGKTANKKLSWSSSNKKYATVSSKGVVSTKKAGAGKTVTITAKATDGSGVSGKVKIKIVKHAVKKITLKCKSKTVKVGKKVTVKATVKTTGKTANKTLSWTTSNKKYATVSSKGVVTTKKAGKGKTVTITAKATDGTGKTARTKIKIKK